MSSIVLGFLYTKILYVYSHSLEILEKNHELKCRIEKTVTLKKSSKLVRTPSFSENM